MSPESLSNGRYDYNRVDSTSGEIRILYLHPGAEHAELSISVQQIHLDDSNRPKYEALSYTWGSAAQKAHLYVQSATEGRKLLVITHSLEKALHALRDKEQSRALWIDAICINQQDNDEKSQQVVMMANIFSLAERVIAWIGPASADSNEALDCLETISLNVRFDWEYNWPVMSTTGKGLSWSDVHSLPVFNDMELQEFANMIYRPYFGRLWVWQETRRGYNTAIMQCGRRIVPWVSFCNAVAFMHLKPKKVCTARQALLERLPNLLLLCRFKRLGRSSLDVVIDDSGWCQCLDPRDRVYALLGFVDRSDSLGLRPDYSKNATEIYTELAKKLIETTKILRPLQFHGQHSHADRLPSLPTWVPDWSKSDPFRHYPEGYAAASSVAAVYHMDNEILSVKGVQISGISRTALFDSFDRSAGTQPPLQGVQLLANFLRTFLAGGQLHASPNNFVSILARVLSRHDPTNTVPPSSETLTTEQFETVVQYALGDMTVDFDNEALWRILVTCDGQRIFLTDTGRYGLGPASISVGDVVAVLLGSVNPIVLRALGNGRYKVIGAVSYDGLMYGEGILGPLPRHHEPVHIRYFEGRPVDRWRFMNQDKGDTHEEDPRLGLMPAGWTICCDVHDVNLYWPVYKHTDGTTTKHDPRLSESELQRRGLDLQSFNLV